jgi:UDP-N-acetylmuramate: L-alanyl-gamma-D-glutamyl-meso-diaminopimelate ligase
MKIYLIGICGTAMANLAGLLKALGHSVSGSDNNVFPPMSDFLREKGISIDKGYENPVPEDIDLVVIGNVVSRGNPQAEQVLREKLPYTSMAAAIGRFFMEKSRNIVITGTHGKTTTTSMTAHILRSAGKNPGFLIGGISRSLNTGSNAGGGEYFVIEGDEYDTAFFDKRSKFVHYSPDILVINNIEFDHADIFDNLKDIEKSFRQVVNLVPDNGVIIANGDQPVIRNLLKSSPAPVLYYGKNRENDFQITIGQPALPLRFSLNGEEYELENMLGEFNAFNAAAAVIASLRAGVSPESIKKSLISFAGVKRRADFITQWKNGALFYQDFAHHPTAVKNILTAFKNAFPERKLIAVLEPRSNTMVRNYHQQSLLEALVEADTVYLADLHRKEKIPEAERLDRDLIFSELGSRGKETHKAATGKEIFRQLKENSDNHDLVVIMSNGAFDNIFELIKEQK